MEKVEMRMDHIKVSCMTRINFILISYCPKILVKSQKSI